jgi:hypothetical protein
MVWQRRAKPPGEFLCRFDSCRLRFRTEDRRLRIEDRTCHSRSSILDPRMYRCSPTWQRHWS